MTGRKEALRQSVKLLGDRLGTELELSSWAPGDGWTRYQVIETCNGREALDYYRGRPLGDKVSTVRGVLIMHIALLSFYVERPPTGVGVIGYGFSKVGR